MTRNIYPIIILAVMAALASASVCNAGGGVAGLILGSKDGDIVVKGVMKGSGAARAGIAKDEAITAIDGVAVRGKSVDEVARMLAGGVGDELSLTMRNTDGTARSAAIIREAPIEPVDPGLPLHLDVPKPHDLRPEDGMVCTVGGVAGRTVTINCGENTGVDRGQTVRFVRRSDYARHTALARGTVAKVERTSAQVTVSGSTGGLEGDEIVAVTSAWRSERARENTLWRVTAHGIRLLDYPSGKPYATIEQLRFDADLRLEQAAVTMMAERLNKAAHVAEQVYGGKIDKGRFRGKSIATAMRNTTSQDVMAFLRFLVTYSDNYVGREWYLPEVYATWLINGTPHAE